MSNGARLISLRAALEATADKERGGLAECIGASALKPFINAELVAAEFLDDALKLTQLREKRLLLKVYRDYKGGELTESQARRLSYRTLKNGGLNGQDLMPPHPLTPWE